MKKQLNLFQAYRTEFHEQEALTIQSMMAYGCLYDHWVFAFSGGKDSSATVTYIIYLVESGQVPAPKKITVQYVDTRMELLPLFASAMNILDNLKSRGIDVNVILPPLDHRFYVYMFGRGIPPPSNTFRWCTPNLKIDPMMTTLRSIYEGTGKKYLLITGVRQGESAQRDGRIAMSCGKNGAECGQGWYQTTPPDEICDKLAPLLHWRVCSVWDWLKYFAPQTKYGGWPTQMVADSYGGDEAEEKNARTGCVACNLASKDVSLIMVCQMPEWAYLSPLLQLRQVYAELKKPQNRLRKTEWQIKKDGKLAKNQNRMGPLTLEARLWGLEQVLTIQRDINNVAKKLGRPTIDLINEEEETRIRALIDTRSWPMGWDGTEKRADEFFEQLFNDGTKQYDLFERLEQWDNESRNELFGG